MPRQSAPAFAGVLANLCLSRNMSKADLARAMKVPDSSASRWLRGLTVPTMQMVDQISDYFGVDRDTLQRLAGHRANTTASLQAGIDPEIATLYDSTVARLREVIEDVPAPFAPTILAASRMSAELARDNVREVLRQAAISKPPESELAPPAKKARKRRDGSPSPSIDKLTTCFPLAA